MAQTMFYFIKFLIIYLTILNSSTATDFDDYYSDDDISDIGEHKSEISSREIISRTNIPQTFIGSNLFGSGIFAKTCFSVEDVALLSTRCKLEALMPNMSLSTEKLEDDKSVEVMLDYFDGIYELLNVIDKEDLKHFSQQAYYDIVGGYLNYFYWPLVKYSFYAGMLTYNSTISVLNLHTDCRSALNTLGNGWRRPIDFFQMKCKIESINYRTNDNGKTKPISTRENACENLLLVSDEDYTDRYETELIVSLPKIETETNDAILNVRLPFKRKQNFNFNSKTAAFVLLKYFVTVTQCYEFRKETPDRFERRFLKLLNEKFLPFLQREEFYPGFGAILRISETLNRRNVVLRNVEEYDLDDYLSRLPTNNQSDHPKSDDPVKPIQSAHDKRNDSSFLEQVIQSVNFGENVWDENQEIEMIFFILVAIVIILMLIILCICIFKGRKKNTQNNLKEVNDKSSGIFNWFKSCFKRLKKDKRNSSNINTMELNISPRSSSIVDGNDWDDTESRISSQRNTSRQSLKDLIHAEVSKRPSQLSKEQIKALTSKKSTKFNQMIKGSCCYKKPKEEEK